MIGVHDFVDLPYQHLDLPIVDQYDVREISVLPEEIPLFPGQPLTGAW